MSVKKTNTLLFFTSTFPTDCIETFVATELEYLSKNFKKIFIYPLQYDAPAYPLPANVVVCPHGFYRPYNRLKLLLKNFFFVWKVYLSCLFSSRHKRKYIIRFWNLFNYLLHRINDARWMQCELGKYDMETTVAYTFWFNISASVLCLVHSRNKKKFRFITRIHGGDFDEQQKNMGFFPFREFEVKNVSSIISVSQYGKNYLKKNYKTAADSVFLSRLGVKNNGDNPFLPEKNYFQIVSCSFIIPVKRLHLIVETLKHIQLPVRWNHFGDGPLRSNIENLCHGLPHNIHWKFAGYMPNREVINYYQNNPVDLLINTSELEGIPVSIMEAISFGIPVVACNICGVPEIVTEKTGFLLDKDFAPSQAAEIICNYLKKPIHYQITFRKQVKEFWRENFNADINYSRFIKQFLS